MPKRKDIKECLKSLLNTSFKQDEQKISGNMLIATGLFNAAKDGNIPAIKAVMEIVGEETNSAPSLAKLYKALSDDSV